MHSRCLHSLRTMYSYNIEISAVLETINFDSIAICNTISVKLFKFTVSIDIVMR